MYRVLIVDDEIISRLGIASLIDWEENGFLLVDSVVNGQEALEHLRNDAIDLVITDIKMPVMDGIELIKRAKKENIDCDFIVLSSFDDYTFVREALKLGALDYILKLDLDKGHIISLLEKAKENISLKDGNETKNISIDKHTIINAKRNILKQLLYGRKTFDDVFLKRLDKYDIYLPYNNYCVLMFKFVNLSETLGEGGIREIIEETLVDYEYAYICDTGYDELSIIYNFNGKSEQLFYKLTYELGNRLSYIMKQYFNQQVTIFVSDVQHKVEDIPVGYLQVCQAFSIKNFVSEEPIVFFNQVKKNRDYLDYKSFEEYIQRFEKALQIMDNTEVNIVLDELIDTINHSKYIEISQIRYITTTMIYIMNSYVEKYGFTKEMFWDIENQQYTLLSELKRKEDFIEFLNESKKKLSKIMIDNDNNHIVNKVRKYILNHYQEAISLKFVAEEHCVTNTYLSMLFKKETGQTLKEYLTNLRIEKAKELLKETNNQIIEISKEVGYDNEHYFSRIFKQKTKMTPTQYRNYN